MELIATLLVAFEGVRARERAICGLGLALVTLGGVVARRRQTRIRGALDLAR